VSNALADALHDTAPDCTVYDRLTIARALPAIHTTVKASSAAWDA
jgi:hypothetical protein